jgi:alpha-amylase/alpha-mannosidase (GH57 family)
VPRIRIALLWHMHQPFYQNPFTGKFELPWVRLHGLKDYFGMVHILKDFPGIRLTFNLVPSLLSQLEGYIGGNRDTFQEIFLKAADTLNDREIDFLIRHFFSAHFDHLIKPYPRYEELYHKRQRYPTDHHDWGGVFDAAELRDLQVWFHLCYFDETYKQHDRQIKNLIEKGRHFSEQDKPIIVDREGELLRKIIPEYKRFWEAGQIELSTSPFYHPILPLLLDPQQARLANPQLPEYDLHFNWKEDALGQLESALDYMERLFGRRPAGIWPSEGSLSAGVLALMEKMNVRWTAGDETVLGRSMGIYPERNHQGVVQNPQVLYRPYTLDRHRLRIFFRDRHLSDLIGFSYQKRPSKEAAADLIQRLKAIPAAANGEAVVPIILDGENAWEYYENSGRDFLREFYRLIEADDSLETVTFSDVLDGETGVIRRFAAGSWINGNFDIWMGHEEDRRAWQLLKETKELAEERQAFLEVQQREEVRRLLFIAQGSDWFWWYGRENYTPDLDIFDRLFRLNLQKVYEILGQDIPPPLSRPVVV